MLGIKRFGLAFESINLELNALSFLGFPDRVSLRKRTSLGKGSNSGLIRDVVKVYVYHARKITGVDMV